MGREGEGCRSIEMGRAEIVRELQERDRGGRLWLKWLVGYVTG